VFAQFSCDSLNFLQFSVTKFDGWAISFYFGHELEELEAPAPEGGNFSATSSAALPSSKLSLKFAGGVSFTASSVLLNLPVLPLNKIIHRSVSLSRPRAICRCLWFMAPY
jgi:hypothetical protein